MCVLSSVFPGGLSCGISVIQVASHVVSLYSQVASHVVSLYFQVASHVVSEQRGQAGHECTGGVCVLSSVFPGGLSCGI